MQGTLKNMTAFQCGRWEKNWPPKLPEELPPCRPQHHPAPADSRLYLIDHEARHSIIEEFPQDLLGLSRQRSFPKSTIHQAQPSVAGSLIYTERRMSRGGDEDALVVRCKSAASEPTDTLIIRSLLILRSAQMPHNPASIVRLLYGDCTQRGPRRSAFSQSCQQQFDIRPSHRSSQCSRMPGRVTGCESVSKSCRCIYTRTSVASQTAQDIEEIKWLAVSSLWFKVYAGRRLRSVASINRADNSTFSRTMCSTLRLRLINYWLFGVFRLCELKG